MSQWQPPRSIYPALLFSLIFWTLFGGLIYVCWTQL